jgi:hypothetical protein
VNFEEEKIILFFKDNLILRDLLTKQITHLNIGIKKPINLWSDTLLDTIGLILSLCKKLAVLNFGDVFMTRMFAVPFFFCRQKLVCHQL